MYSIYNKLTIRNLLSLFKISTISTIGYDIVFGNSNFSEVALNNTGLYLTLIKNVRSTMRNTFI